MSKLTRAQALMVLREGNERLLAAVSSLSPESREKPGVLAGGEWSAKDLVGHITTWEELAIETLEGWRSDDLSRVRGLNLGPGGVDELNAEEVARKASRSYDDVYRAAVHTHESLITEIESMSDEEWYSKKPTPRGEEALVDSLGGILGAPKQPFGHVFAHLD